MKKTLIQQIDDLLHTRSLLRHPFYVSWSAGTLTLEALSGYAKEYFQLVKAIPECVETLRKDAPPSMKTTLMAHEAEERSHIDLWRPFANTLGIAPAALEGYEGLDKTKEAVSLMRKLSDSYASGAVAMYAFEKALPEISDIKLDGLQRFYGIQATEATTYFKVHGVVDIVHARMWADAVMQLDKPREWLFSVAEHSLDAQHILLDSCYEAYCASDRLNH